MDRAGQIAHSILCGLYDTDLIKYQKVLKFMENIENFIWKRGYSIKDGVRLGKFTPSEVKFLKTLYNKG